ncbi:LysM peptidoglycan-binding domain-containing protein [Chitinophaga sp. SYP-B3965]|uniref:DPBB and LysM peptidoglycan-binding domain-containing protein n=1 Tax=Chitinophaga sp. SYP-B3965 TaxID=2663120 RepID=UPI001299A6EB|nr:LysM peptidoglycan-binding domain-containing protein [Chitinophaga sp. SYP-B3965]MRG45916.1 LysM peptidoglycan-binding domain-containing protein [Chitinophaga sp. SYP-B3965]
MLKSVLIGVFMVSTIGVAAQDTLVAQGSAPDLYLTHTVKKGETWYSLGRAYGLSPKDIAAKNKMQMDQGLSLGKGITIPLSKSNFIQSKEAHTGEGSRPVYHQVTDKETLYRISLRFDKVPLDNVRQWNNFTGDGVKKDAYLIVGFVKGSGHSIVLPVAAPAAPVVAKQEAPKQDPPPVAKQDPPPVVKQDPPAVVKQEKQEVVDEKPVAVTKSQGAEPETKQEQPDTKPSTSLGRTPNVPDGGFEQQYQQQTNNGRNVVGEKGPGTWFRSNAVVGSGKYYALHNTAPRGTIVKVTNPLTGKSIYAKVLDAIPQLKANANLIIKLSDAAQDALGINETRFYCELSYDEK